MKARLTRRTRAWVTLLVLGSAPVWATQPPTMAASQNVSLAANDGARAPAAVTRLAWDRVGAPLKDLS